MAHRDLMKEHGQMMKGSPLKSCSSVGELLTEDELKELRSMGHFFPVGW